MDGQFVTLGTLMCGCTQRAKPSAEHPLLGKV